MLSLTYLQQLTTKYQTSELNIHREYFQNLLLSYLYQNTASTSLYFKGGTALRLIFHSPRFSEDLDFDTTNHDYHVWEIVIEQTLSNLALEGFTPDIIESKTTTRGYLSIVEFKNLGQPIRLHLEISFRSDQCSGEVFTIENDFVIPYPVKGLNTKHLIDGKIQALFARQKARDFYDLYFLLRANLVSLEQKKQLVKVKHLLSKNTTNFERELAIFLPKSQHLIIKDFRTTLLGEIERSV